jgi:hypothetical protein
MSITQTKPADTVEAHLDRFDELDFEAFNKQNWELFNQIHTEKVLVNFPDGHQTSGIEKHDEDMKAMFAWSPDLKIISHPVKFGSGEWTAVIGIMTGTFTRQMALPDGTSLQPTGKAFKIPMCTVAHWQNGRMIEESLFWDTGAMMQQIGAAK